jgi:hypothetical protein
MEVVLHGPHIGEAKLLGALGEPQGFTPVLRGGFLIRADRGEELDPEFHRLPRHGAGINRYALECSVGRTLETARFPGSIRI